MQMVLLSGKPSDARCQIKFCLWIFTLEKTEESEAFEDRNYLFSRKAERSELLQYQYVTGYKYGKIRGGNANLPYERKQCEVRLIVCN